MRKKEKGKSLRYAFYFILLILFFGGLSIAFKIGFIIKNSNFDGNHRYNLQLTSNHTSSFISFSPETRSISILNANGPKDENMPQSLKIPIDGVIESESPVRKSEIFVKIAKAIPQTFNINSSPTILDILRLMFFTKGIGEDSIEEKDITIPREEYQIQQIVSPLFLDQSIAYEKKSIEIINSTDEPGLGARLAILLNNIGANIILVVSSEKSQKVSTISYVSSDSDSYTVNRLFSMLGYKKIKQNNKGIADIIIILGEDQIKTNKF
jgi:hypothetical protein